MITIINENQRCKNLIVFIHGFIGGKKTWLKNDGSMPFISQLTNKAQIKENFDIGIFAYHTELL